MPWLSPEGFRNFFKYYSGEPHQDKAIDQLYMDIDRDLLAENSEWVKTYRTPSNPPKVEPEPAGEPTVTSQDGVDLIKEFEGCVLSAYPDPGTGGDPWTVGYGHTGPEVKPGYSVTHAEAEAILKKDLHRFEEAVSRLIEVPFTQHEFDATVSFTFNCGAGALESSTFRRRINAGEDKATCFREEFPKWVNGGNGPLPGLVRRREAEVQLATS